MTHSNLRPLVFLGWLSLVAVAGAQETFTVSVCFSHTPTTGCSAREQSYSHSLSLEGPIPFGGSRSADRHSLGGPYEFHDVRPGGYIVRTAGCNPFGCWMDTPVVVVDQDVGVAVRQIAGQPLTPKASPTVTPTVVPCLGDGNDDQSVTIEELVGAVANALTGCPSN